MAIQSTLLLSQVQCMCVSPVEQAIIVESLFLCPSDLALWTARVLSMIALLTYICAIESNLGMKILKKKNYHGHTSSTHAQTPTFTAIY